MAKRKPSWFWGEAFDNWRPGSGSKKKKKPTTSWLWGRDEGRTWTDLANDINNTGERAVRAAGRGVSRTADATVNTVRSAAQATGDGWRALRDQRFADFTNSQSDSDDRASTETESKPSLAS